MTRRVEVGDGDVIHLGGCKVNWRGDFGGGWFGGGEVDLTGDLSGGGMAGRIGRRFGGLGGLKWERRCDFLGGSELTGIFDGDFDREEVWRGGLKRRFEGEIIWGGFVSRIGWEFAVLWIMHLVATTVSRRFDEGKYDWPLSRETGGEASEAVRLSGCIGCII